MANNKFDIKVFTDELNKAFTILKKEQVLEKYMKNILLNYNSIIYIGNITDEPNIYNTIYNYMYGEDNTLCNIVIFETDGFVDSATNIIPSGIHIAFPYLDYSVCIDYKYILNINNSAELLTPTQEFKTINNESILGEGNISVQEPLVSGTNIKTVNGQTMLGNGNIPVQEPLVSGTNIKTVNEQSLLGTGNIAVQEPLVSGTNIKTINGQTILGSGNLEINDSNAITIDLGNISADSGTLSSEIITKINNNLNSKSIIFKGTLSGDIPVPFTTSDYTVLTTSGITVIGITFLFGTSLNIISITLPSGSYTHTSTIWLDETNTKTINNQSLKGKGNIAVQEPLVSGTNIKTVNGNSLLGSGNVPVQEPLISGTNIKTINNQSILGEGNIEISGGESDTVIIDLGTLAGMSGTLSSDILSKINSAISENKNISIKANLDGTMAFPNVTYGGGNLYCAGFLYIGSDLNAVILNITLTTGQYVAGFFDIQDKLDSGTNIKTINNQSLVGSGNISVQEKLLSGTNIKTVSGNSLLGSGNIELQEPLVSGTNIKTINNQSILGAGNIEISGGESANTIKIIECSPGAQLDTDTLQKLQSGKYALYITGTMFYPTSDTKRFNTVPYFNYFGTSIQMCYESVAINQANYLETISTYSIDLDIKKTSE